MVGRYAKSDYVKGLTQVCTTLVPFALLWWGAERLKYAQVGRPPAASMTASELAVWRVGVDHRRIGADMRRAVNDRANTSPLGVIGQRIQGHGDAVRIHPLS